MNRHYKLSFISLVFSFCLNGMEVEQPAPVTNLVEKITLLSKEGIPVYLSKTAVEKSETLKSFLNNGIEQKTKIIDLSKQNVDVSTLKLIQLLLEVGDQQRKNILLKLVANKNKKERKNKTKTQKKEDYNFDKIVNFLMLHEFLLIPCHYLVKNKLLQKIVKNKRIEFNCATLPSISDVDVDSQFSRLDGNFQIRQIDNNILAILDTNTYKTLHLLEGCDDKFLSVAIGEECIVAGSKERTVKVWDKKSGRLRHTLHGHSSWVLSVAISGDCIISGSKDGTIKIWDNRSGKEMQTLNGHQSPVRSIVIDGNSLISMSYDKVTDQSHSQTVKIWNLANYYEFLKKYDEFENFLNELPLFYCSLFLKFLKVLSGNSAKINLSDNELEIYKHFQETIGENWGADMQEIIKQTLDKYLYNEVIASDIKKVAKKIVWVPSKK